MSFWPGVPSFVDGQIISAEGHLNRLARAERFLFGLAMGSQFPLASRRTVELYDTYRTVWEGAIRHRRDILILECRFYSPVSNQFQARVKYGDTVVMETAPVTVAGAETKTFTSDLTAYGLTDGQFYEVTVEVRTPAGHCLECYAIPLQISEMDAVTYPELASFAEGDTPTAADWNALSEYASALWEATRNPRPPFPGRWAKHTSVSTELLWAGMHHRAERLRYQVWRKKDETTYKIRIYARGVLIREITDATPPVYTPENSASPFPDSDLYYPYTEDLDISGLGIGVGDTYIVRIEGTEGENPLDQYAKGIVDYVYEVPGDPISAPGWYTLPDWSHGDVVHGNAGEPRVQWLRDNLIWLTSRLGMVNPACHVRYDDAAKRPFEFWSERRWRWLHYYSRSGDEPTLLYYFGGEWQEEPLSAEQDYSWHTLDLDSIDGLAVGRRYMIRGCKYAFEDTDT